MNVKDNKNTPRKMFKKELEFVKSGCTFRWQRGSTGRRRFFLGGEDRDRWDIGSSIGFCKNMEAASIELVDLISHQRQVHGINNF
jgi:hypothetical protein